MARAVTRTILTETALAVLFTVITLMVAHNSIDLIRVTAGSLICLRILFDTMRIVLKNYQLIVIKTGQVKLVLPA